MPSKHARSPVPAAAAAAAEESDDEVFEVEKIVEHKEEYDEDGRVVNSFRVRWKGYSSSQDTWEPRDSLEDGAQDALKKYIEDQKMRRKPVRDEGSLPSKAKEKEIKRSRASEGARASTYDDDDAVEAPKKKKRESAPVEPDASFRRKTRDVSPPVSTSRVKAKKTIEIDDEEDYVEDSIAEEAEKPKSKRKEKERKAPESQDQAPQSQRSKDKDASRAQEKVASKHKEKEAPRKSTSHRDEGEQAPATKSPNKSVPVVEVPVAGSTIHQAKSSWEELVNIETLEVDLHGDYRWAIKWSSPPEAGRTEWISNRVARHKFPQRLIDFYQDHLRFKSGEEYGADDEGANGHAGNANMQVD